MIAQSQRINETTVLRHINDYLTSEKLSSENGGSHEHLSVAQTDELIQFLIENTQVTTQAIIAQVENLYGVSYSVAGMNKWLHRNGFTYKKPVGIPHKFDAEKQKLFIEEYEALKLKPGNHEPILFMDASDPTMSTKLSYGWLLKGERKTLETTGSRTKMNIIGVVNLKDIGSTIVREHQKINSETICQFFSDIRQVYPISRKIHLILDGAPWHKTPLVKDVAVKMNIYS